jgi:ribosomal protein S18 acetylase RimI-like enzyme
MKVGRKLAVRRALTMNSRIRRAAPGDVPAIKRIVLAAYEKYIPRIGKPPAPMTDDYDRQVASGNVWVLELDGELLGLVVLVPKPVYMLIDNVAVTPERQRSGLGRKLLDFAEAKAREQGYLEVQLYTNELMHENLAWYRRLGYEETSRTYDLGFRRVFMKKQM